MSVTVIGGGSVTYPRTEAQVLVETKAAWADDWHLETEILPVRASWHSGHDVGELVLERRYDDTLWDMHEDAFVARDPLNIRGRWVRLRLLGASGLQTIWQGVIESEQRELRAHSQKWVAYGPQNLLRKIDVHHCLWWDGAAILDLGRVPSVNIAGAGGLLTGNMSTSRQGATHLYSRGAPGAALWSHYDYLEYVLERFVNASGRPVWTIGGQTSILRNLNTYIPLTGRESAMDLLQKLIPPRFGVDYMISPTGAGFEVRVFALTGVGSVVGGADLPMNPNLTRIDLRRGLGSHEVTECQVEHSSAQEYDHVRIVGARKRTQFSCYGSDLRALWASAAETAYKAGTGTPADSAELHDNARRAEKYRGIFQAFGAIAAFDFDGGTMLPPPLNLAGEVVSGVAAQQLVERATLADLLTREGWDYTGASPANDNPSGVEADFVPALVLAKVTITDHALEGKYLALNRANKMAEDTGIAFKVSTISVFENDWGIHLEVEPNHALAKGHWSGAEDSNFAPATDGFDYEDLILTIAIETDTRLEVGVDISPALGAGDGSTLVLEAPNCHYWYLAPGTAVDVDAAGAPVWSYNLGITLRNDAPKMLHLAAGAAARYLYGRSRCRLRKKRLEAWTELVGTILTLVEDEGDLQLLNIPITTVQWDFGESDRGTTVRAGYSA